MNPNPTVFISYSWDDNSHKVWVADLATRLRGDGVDAVLDQWAAIPGDQLPNFMEKEIRNNDYVLIVCTPNYKYKSDNRDGGVGYEGDIMTAEITGMHNNRKYIPILARGTWQSAAPSWLKGKYYVDLSNDSMFEQGYNDLLATVQRSRPKAPPLGKSKQKVKKASTRDGLSPLEFEEPIKILGVIVDEVTVPKMDGTPKSALYRIPLRLSRTPSALWRKLFLEAWALPPRRTMMHRSQMASVLDDKVILDGTTIEEVARFHRETLVLCVETANNSEKSIKEEQRIEEEHKRQRQEEHEEKIKRIAKNIRFD